MDGWMDDGSIDDGSMDDMRREDFGRNRKKKGMGCEGKKGGASIRAEWEMCVEKALQEAS